MRMGISLLLAVLFITGVIGLIYSISLVVKAIEQYEVIAIIVVIALIVAIVVLIGVLAYTIFHEKIEHWIDRTEDWVAERKTKREVK